MCYGQRLIALLSASIFSVDTGRKLNVLCTFNLVLGKLAPRKIAHNPKTNPNRNPNHNWGAIFLSGNCLVPPNPKTNPNLDPNPNPNQGGFCSGSNCPGVIFLGEQLSGCRSVYVLCLRGYEKTYNYNHIKSLLMIICQ